MPATGLGHHHLPQRAGRLLRGGDRQRAGPDREPLGTAARRRRLDRRQSRRRPTGRRGQSRADAALDPPGSEQSGHERLPKSRASRRREESSSPSSTPTTSSCPRNSNARSRCSAPIPRSASSSDRRCTGGAGLVIRPTDSATAFGAWAWRRSPSSRHPSWCGPTSSDGRTRRPPAASSFAAPRSRPSGVSIDRFPVLYEDQAFFFKLLLVEAAYVEGRPGIATGVIPTPCAKSGFGRATTPTTTR